VNSEPVQFNSEPSAQASNAFADSSLKLDRLIDGVRSLEQWYAADFERRIAGITELLKNQIAEELRRQFSSELNTQVEQLRRQYEERLYTQASQWETQRGVLEKEIEGLRRRVPGQDLINEISATETILSTSASRESFEIERLIPDAVALGRLLQSRVEELERRAYLRGLKFRTPEGQ